MEKQPNDLDILEEQTTITFSLEKYEYHLHSHEESRLFGEFYESITVYCDNELNDISQNFYCSKLEHFDFNYVLLVLIAVNEGYFKNNKKEDQMLGQLGLEVGLASNLPLLTAYVGIRQFSFSNMVSLLSKNKAGRFSFVVKESFPERLKDILICEITEYHYDI